MSGASRRGAARPSPRRLLESSRARARDGIATGGPAQAGAASRCAPTRRRASPPLRNTRIQPAGQRCGFDACKTAALCQRPRPPPVKAARSPKTRPRVRSAPTLEPSNDERLPPSALANSSPQNPIAHREGAPEQRRTDGQAPGHTDRGRLALRAAQSHAGRLLRRVVGTPQFHQRTTRSEIAEKTSRPTETAPRQRSSGSQSERAAPEQPAT